MASAAEPGWLRDGLRDVLAGSRFLGCERPGRLLCPSCGATLRSPARRVEPQPCPPGLARCWAAWDYSGLAKDVINGHKEHSYFGLRTPLARTLADVVVAASAPAVDPVVLVPIPSARATTRARGYAPLQVVVRMAASRLRAQGHEVRTQTLLRPWCPARDQVGLNASQRYANLRDSLVCDSAAVRRLGRRQSRAWVVLCDDVITTGATAYEAQRALVAAGLRPASIAAIAATQRTWQPRA